MFTYITLALATVASVSGLAIPRQQGKPATYGSWLEDYDQYHNRYVAIGCTGKQGTPFFESCCRPMLAGQVLEKARQPQCIPNTAAVNPSSTVSAPAAPTATDNSEDDWCYEGDENCECDNDTELSTAASAATSTETPEPRPNTTVEPTSAPAVATPPPTNNAQVIKGGRATFFYQNGVAGSCGKVNGDDALIVALPSEFYGAFTKVSDKCGKQVQVTRVSTGKSIIATVADGCPGCKGGDLDLSVGAFRGLGEDSEGVYDITYTYV